MASLIATSKRDLFDVKLYDSTPVSTKYNIPSSFAAVSVVKKNTKSFGRTGRDGPMDNYLRVNNPNGPNPTEYQAIYPGTFGPATRIGSDASNALYLPPKGTVLSSMDRVPRFPVGRQVQSSVGDPGLYTPSKADAVVKPLAKVYTFSTSSRPSLAKKGGWGGAGPGSYNLANTVKGERPIGKSSSDSLDTLTAILNSTAGYKHRRFGTVPRFEDPPNIRVRLPKKYEKLAQSAELDGPPAAPLSSKGTFGVSPQFTLFNVKSDVPGPGSYNPLPVPLVQTGNVKLGRKMPVPGGNGVDGEAIGDDDSFQNADELVGAALIVDTGDESIDKAMRGYRKEIERRLLEGDHNEAQEQREERERRLSELGDQLFSGAGKPAMPQAQFFPHNEHHKTQHRR